MGTVDLLAMINDAQALGLSLNTNGDKLNVTGPKTPAAAALVQQLAQNKAALLDLLRAPLQPAPIAEPTDPAPPCNPAYDAPVTPGMLSKADLDPKDPTMLAHYKHYVGKVVSDEVITGLILDANRYGFRITFDAQGDWRNACDYLVTSARFA